MTLCHGPHNTTLLRFPSLIILPGLMAILLVLWREPDAAGYRYAGVPWSDGDRHYTILTVIGEAARQPDAGRAAVAAVILNRALDGRFGGRRPKQVVLHRWKKRKGGRVVTVFEFEPWMHAARRRWLVSLDRRSALYQGVARIVDGVRSGRIADPTGGALYFYNPDIVRKRRKRAGEASPAPGFARGRHLVRIGDHVFVRTGRIRTGKNER